MLYANFVSLVHERIRVEML